MFVLYTTRNSQILPWGRSCDRFECASLDTHPEETVFRRNHSDGSTKIWVEQI